jgi:hypothetical protein
MRQTIRELVRNIIIMVRLVTVIQNPQLDQWSFEHRIRAKVHPRSLTSSESSWSIRALFELPNRWQSVGEIFSVILYKESCVRRLSVMQHCHNMELMTIAETVDGRYPDGIILWSGGATLFVRHVSIASRTSLGSNQRSPSMGRWCQWYAHICVALRPIAHRSSSCGPFMWQSAK